MASFSNWLSLHPIVSEQVLSLDCPMRHERRQEHLHKFRLAKGISGARPAWSLCGINQDLPALYPQEMPRLERHLGTGPADLTPCLLRPLVIFASR